MKNHCVNIRIDLNNASFGVKMANLNKYRNVGKVYESERLNRIGMLPEHLKTLTIL
jgi:hypothetical protein